jgi:hypothetical protein
MRESQQKQPLSEAQLKANRQNAQKCTGPRTPEGKRTSSMNAVKTGLTSRRVILTEEDAVFYQQHIDRHFDEFSPVTDREKVLVQSIADAEWRINSIVPLLASLHAIGRRDLAPLVEEIADPDLRESELAGRIYEKYRRDFQNLALQERRLRSHKQNDIAELLAIRNAQKEKEAEVARLRAAEIARALKIGNNCIRAKKEFFPEEYGFDFSGEEYAHYHRRNREEWPICEKDLDFDTVLTAYRAAKKEQAPVQNEEEAA